MRDFRWKPLVVFLDQNCRVSPSSQVDRPLTFWRFNLLSAALNFFLYCLSPLRWRGGLRVSAAPPGLQYTTPKFNYSRPRAPGATDDDNFSNSTTFIFAFSLIISLSLPLSRWTAGKATTQNLPNLVLPTQMVVCVCVCTLLRLDSRHHAHVPSPLLHGLFAKFSSTAQWRLIWACLCVYRVE